MGNTLRFIYATEAQILALAFPSEKWVDRAFYYPEDKPYFYQALNGEMKKYGGDVEGIGTGVKLNGTVLGGVKSFIEDNDTLLVPVFHEYNVFNLRVDGIVNCFGIINMM